jgi:hypothetical protein
VRRSICVNTSLQRDEGPRRNGRNGDADPCEQWTCLMTIGGHLLPMLSHIPAAAITEANEISAR